jgi:hypothetical protein
MPVGFWDWQLLKPLKAWDFISTGSPIESSLSRKFNDLEA